MASFQDALSALPGVKGNADIYLDQNALQEYDEATKRARESRSVPGCCSIVIFRDRLLHAKAYGKADLESGAPMRLDTLMRLYCLTKPMVSTALMILVEQGRCRLDDELLRYLPCFGDVCVGSRARKRPAEGKLTLRKLLTHTSGLGYAPMLATAADKFEKDNFSGLLADVDEGRIRNLAEFCEALSALPLRFHPGKRYFYSFGLDVIGRVIEVISGTTLDVFLKKHLFDPLGMKDTTFAVSKTTARQGRLAALYGSPSERRSMGEAPTQGETRHNSIWGKLVRMDGARAQDSAWVEHRVCPILSGGGIMGQNWGGLLSTALDQTRFALMLARHGQLAPGRKRILKISTVKAMTAHDWLQMKSVTGQIQRDAGKPFGWNGLGEIGISPTAASRDPEAFELGEWGMGGGACTHWSVNPSRKLICLWFTQNLATRGWPGWNGSAQNLWRAARLVAASAAPTLRSRTAGAKSQQKRSAAGNATSGSKRRKV